MKKYPFKETSQCRKLPERWRGAKPEKPVAHLSDEEIDEACQLVLQKGFLIVELPKTQYGRRVMVETFFKYENIRPLSNGVDVPTPFQPAQPR